MSSQNNAKKKKRDCNDASIKFLLQDGTVECKKPLKDKQQQDFSQ